MSAEEELAGDMVSSYIAEKLISFEEYSSIICNRQSLSNDDNNKVKNMEDFLFEVMTYKDYLTPELNNIYERFQQLWEYLITIKETTEVIESTKKRYQDMQDRSEQRTVKNVQNKVTSLQRKLSKDDGGYVNALLYVGIVIFVGIVIGVITFLAK